MDLGKKGHVWGTQLGENQGRNSVVVIYFMREESIFNKITIFFNSKNNREKRRDRNRTSDTSFNEEI